MLTNDGGSWVGDGRGFGGPSDGGGIVALSGRDGYEGLSAFLIHGGDLDRGYWDAGIELVVRSGDGRQRQGIVSQLPME